MTRRILAVVAVLLLFGATAVVAVAIWPERAGESGSTGVKRPGTSPALTSPAVDAPPAVTAPDIGTAPLGVDTRFALLPVTGPPPVRYRFKHPPLAGCSSM